MANFGQGEGTGAAIPPDWHDGASAAARSRGPLPVVHESEQKPVASRGPPWSLGNLGDAASSVAACLPTGHDSTGQTR